MEAEADPFMPVVTNRSVVQMEALMDDSYERKPCSYCKSTRGSQTDLGFYSTAFTTLRLRADDYETLIQRGFTRSGTYLYVRSIIKSCCEVYAYRVDADQFQPSKSQKKALLRFHRYLRTGLKHAEPQDSQMKVTRPQSELELKFKQVIQTFFAKALDEQPCYGSHKVYLRGSTLSSNLMHLLSKSHRQILTHDVLSQLCEELQSLEQGSKANVKNLFINLVVPSVITAKAKPHKQNQVEEEICQPDYQKYFLGYLPDECRQGVDKVRYTVSIHKAVYTEELFELYSKYELAVHSREVTPQTLRSHLCNSPVFDPAIKTEYLQDCQEEDIDSARLFKDEGVDVKARGSYHMYHRLDGKLVAVGNLDFLQNVLNSGYFIYDPDFKFLNLGVVGALKELEYIRRVRQSQNKYKWYVLGDLVTRCSKVNYKLQYQPGYILCPRTKLAVPFVNAEPSIKLIETCSVEDKQQMDVICFCDQSPQKTPEEMVLAAVQNELQHCPILYNGQRWITCQNILSAEIKLRFQRGMYCLLRECGLQLFQRLQFNLTNKQPDPQPQPEPPMRDGEEAVQTDSEEMEETKE